MDVVDLPLEQIIPYARNPRRNEQAIATVAASIQEFGWRQPIVVDEAMVVLAGHTRLEAARKLGFKTAPVHVAKGLTVSQARAFRIMDNRSSENAEWDKDLLNLELADLLEADFDLGLTGFTEDELNALMSSLEDGTGPQEGEDDVPETPEEPVSRPGDLWILGNHRLLCGDSTSRGAAKPKPECAEVGVGADGQTGNARLAVAGHTGAKRGLLRGAEFDGHGAKAERLDDRTVTDRTERAVRRQIDLERALRRRRGNGEPAPRHPRYLDADLMPVAARCGDEA